MILSSVNLQILVGFALGILVGYVAFRLGALNGSGAVSAAIIGGLIFGFGGVPAATLLLIFFVSSSLLSRAYSQRKKSLSEKFAKGSRRDYGQVLANGGLAAILVIVHWFVPDEVALWIAYAGSMAAVNADTWSTELGVLSLSSPRLITNGRKVTTGTSGGVTAVGYLASFAGAGIIGIAAAVFAPGLQAGIVVTVVIFGGLTGATIDSLLGATVQGIYYCPNCDKETESYPEHHCGTETIQLRGWQWLNNDVVNLICSLVGAVTALGVWLLIR